MKLYKNVDICDLESIMENGILSIDECRNDNWEDGKRVNNDTSVVYLFDPIGKCNTFPESYGVALLEVECDARVSEMEENDKHRNDYTEYITEKVTPSEIKRIIIPEIFKPYIDIPDGIDVTWCGMKAEWYDNDRPISYQELEECSEDVLKVFAKSAKLSDSTRCEFFRGFDERMLCIDLFNVEYIFND